MPGGLLELSYRNQQDAFLTGMPEFSFFKIVYHRYSNFSLELKEYPVAINFGGSAQFKLSNDGDLIKNLFLQIELPEIEVVKKDLEALKWDYQTLSEVPLITPSSKTSSPGFVINDTRRAIYLQRIKDAMLRILQEKKGNYQNQIFLQELVSILSSSSSTVYDTDQITAPLSKRIIKYYETYANLEMSDLLQVNICELYINFVLNLINTIIQALEAVEISIFDKDILVYFDSSIINLFTSYISDNTIRNLITLGVSYVDVNTKFLNSWQSNNFFDLAIELASLNKKVLLQTSATDYSVIYTNYQNVVKDSLAYTYKQLIILGYEESYVSEANKEAEDFVNDPQNRNPNLTQVQIIYSKYFPEIIIQYLFEKYETNNTTKFNFSFIGDYYVLFVKYFLQIYDSYLSESQGVDLFVDLSVLDPLVADVRQYLSTGGLATLKESLIALKLKLQMIYDSLAVSSYLFFNLGYLTNFVTSLQISSTYINLFRSDVLKRLISLIKDLEFYDYVSLFTGIRLLKMDYELINNFFNLERVISDNIYEDNTPVVIQNIQELLSTTLPEGDIQTLQSYISKYNFSKSSLYIDKIAELTSLTSASIKTIFDIYPYYGTTFQSTVQDNKLLSIITLNSYLNDIFLEECYYEYVHDKKEMIKQNFSVLIDLSNVLSALGPYEKVVVSSFYYFNLEHICKKVPIVSTILRSIYASTTWGEKIKFINILSYENFLNYVRTNEKYAIYLYGEWLKKINGTKKYQTLKTETFYGLNITEVEKHYYTPRLQRILERYNADTYAIYLTLKSSELLLKYNAVSNLLQEDNIAPVSVNIYNNDSVLNLSEGRYYSAYEPKFIIIRPRTIVRFFRKPFFHDEVYTVQSSDIPIELDYPTILKLNIAELQSLIIQNVESGFVYKDIIVNDSRIDIVNNDVKLIFNSNTILLTREVPVETNWFAYFEALRWYRARDYNYLIKQNYKANLRSEVSFPTNLDVCWVKNVGHKILQGCQLFIGDQKIDEIDSDWLDINKSYLMPMGHDRGYNIITQNVRTPKQSKISKKLLHLPLPFWFCKNNSTSLPIVSLTNTQATFKFKLENLENLLENYNPIGIVLKSKIKVKVLVEYIFLDTVERLNFIQKKHNYIFHQLKIVHCSSITSEGVVSFRLNFPVIDIFFVVRKKESYEPCSVIESVELNINGVPLNKTKDANVFQILVPHEKYYRSLDGVIVFSFAQYPKQVQPSGSLNFYYVANSFLKFVAPIDYAKYEVVIYAREYNILQIMSGQGGLLFN